MASESHFKTIQQLTCFVMNNGVKCVFFTLNIVLASVSCVFFMLASKNNLKLKNIFSSFFFKFRKGIVFSTFWRQKSISEKSFSKHDKFIATVLNINSASKVLEKNTSFIINMASESHFKTIQQPISIWLKIITSIIFFHVGYSFIWSFLSEGVQTICDTWDHFSLVLFHTSQL
jgi:hypothetical protein